MKEYHMANKTSNFQYSIPHPMMVLDVKRRQLLAIVDTLETNTFLTKELLKSYQSID